MAKKPTKAKAETAAPVVITSIKGFDQDLKCRGYQFEVGKTYEHTGKVEQCASGFHACPIEHHPLSVFEFYAPAGNRFFEVRQGGKTSNGGTKLASATITIDFELTIGDLVKRAWDYVWSRATKSVDAHVTVEGHAASATGDLGAASATGYQGAASATGDLGAAISSYEGRVMGAEGNALFGIERDDNLDILSVAAGIVGRDGIRPNVWYKVVGGKLVEA